MLFLHIVSADGRYSSPSPVCHLPVLGGYSYLYYFCSADFSTARLQFHNLSMCPKVNHSKTDQRFSLISHLNIAISHAGNSASPRNPPEKAEKHHQSQATLKKFAAGVLMVSTYVCTHYRCASEFILIQNTSRMCSGTSL